MISRPASDGQPAATPEAVCCARPMSVITVTRTAPSASLTLASCTRCGRHAWLQAGEAIDRSALIGAVRDGVATQVGQAPTRHATFRDVRDQLSTFTVLGATTD